MKRILSLFMVLALLLAGCGSQTSPQTETTVPPTEASYPQSDPDAFRFTRENFPRLDGSTSMVPLGQGIASVLLGIPREETGNLVEFSRTTQSFHNLRYGDCDIVIAAEPNPIVFDELKEAGVAYEMETIAREALVFVVNENNPVDSLTAQQVKDIYSGAITNWSQVGGLDQPIEAFQRNTNAGSQVMMEKLVMQGTPMVTAPESYIVGEMGMLIDAVKSYNNSANAIGYTVFYYAHDMQMAQGLKILKIDGIEPKAETLQNESYPFLNGYYCCIPAKATEAARQLYRWLVSEAGQNLLRLEGYVPVTPQGQAPSSGGDVHMDYTAYAPTGGTPAKFTTLPGGPTERLVASPDYGPIYPFLGSWDFTSYDGGYYDYRTQGCKGFYNRDGVLITQPSYADIYPVLFTWEHPEEGFIWVMNTEVSEDSSRYTFASPDGRFVCPKEYASIYSLETYLVCTDGDTYDVYDKNLNIVKTEKDFQIDGHIAIPSSYRDGKFVCSVSLDNQGGYESYLFSEDGTVLSGPWSHISLYTGGIAVYHTEDYDQLVERNGVPITVAGERLFTSFYPVNENYFEVQTLDNRHFLVDQAGIPVLWSFDRLMSDTTDDGGFVLMYRDGRSTYYNSNATPRYTDSVPEQLSHLAEDLFCRRNGNDVTIFNLLTGDRIGLKDCNNVYWVTGPRVCVTCNDGEHLYLVDADLKVTEMNAASVSSCADYITWQKYLLCQGNSDADCNERVFTLDGKQLLFQANGTVNIIDGHYTVSSSWAFSDYDEQGNLIFCYPYYGLTSE